jgi:3-phenylpropionate/trans-cinnamate dioxygenase ferredoxin reductase subunit
MATLRAMTTTTEDGIAIAGGGLAGQRCAETLRREGYDGPIRMICSEPHRPYDRPPLSKALLTGADDAASLAFRPAGWYRERGIDLLMGVRATGLELAGRRLRLSDGGALRFSRLLIATGGTPRTLPLLAGYDNVSVLRTLDDALALRSVLRASPRLAVVGAGFIGLEIAATARRLGAEVTVIEAASAPLAGVLGDELGAWFTRLHRAEGVRVLTGASVDRVIAACGSVRAMVLAAGAVVEADHVVVGVGIAPDVGWLADSGLRAPAGVAADPHGRTAIDGVFAAGDAAATFDPGLGRHLPGSHWEAAARQGARVARLMLGLDPGPAPLTSFWTDQYGLRIQYVGRARPGDELAIDGDPESRQFAARFTRDGRAVAALLVNRPRCLPAARTAIEKGQPWPTWSTSTSTPAPHTETASTPPPMSSSSTPSPT